MNNKRITLGGGSYETPASEIVEVHSEGILCASNTQQSSTIEMWGEMDNVVWDEE